MTTEGAVDTPQAAEGTGLAPAVENAPSPWSVVHEYSKTVITLSSALLATTVTFSEKILSPNSGQEQRVLLITTWIFLLLAIVASLFSAAALSNYLRHGGQPFRCILFSNAAFFFLVFAGTGFVALGSFQAKPRTDLTTPRLVRTAVASLQRSEAGRGWRPVAWSRRGRDLLDVALVDGSDTLRITLSHKDGDIIEYQRIH